MASCYHIREYLVKVLAADGHEVALRTCTSAQAQVGLELEADPVRDGQFSGRPYAHVHDCGALRRSPKRLSCALDECTSPALLECLSHGERLSVNVSSHALTISHCHWHVKVPQRPFKTLAVLQRMLAYHPADYAALSPAWGLPMGSPFHTQPEVRGPGRRLTKRPRDLRGLRVEPHLPLIGP